VTTLDEFRGLKVGVIPETTWAEAAVEAGVPVGSQIACADLNDAIDALRKGRATATVMAVFDFALAQKHDPALEAGMFLGTPGVAAWAVRKQDVVFLGALNGYLQTLRMSPAKSMLLVKYFSEDALSLLRRARKE
jgi:ABC-type amino acid transport substrate-binding protein